MNTYDDAVKWRHIGDSIFVKDVRDWRKNDYAGEGLEIVENDRSGCYRNIQDSKVCAVPHCGVVRVYKRNHIQLTATLHYPVDEKGYYWEVFPIEALWTERFLTDYEMEKEIRKYFKETDNENIGYLYG